LKRPGINPAVFFRRKFLHNFDFGLVFCNSCKQKSGWHIRCKALVPKCKGEHRPVIQCRSLRAEDRPQWDSFVQAHPLGSPFHLMAWHDTVQHIFGYRPEYRLAVEGNTIVGVLPLFLVENFVMGRVLISTPFAVYGGILATDDTAQDLLAHDARRLAEREGVQYLELRNSFEDQTSGFSGVDRYATFTRDVSPMSSDALLQSLPQKTRNVVRKALKHPYTMRVAHDLDAFYSLLLETYRRHGTPVFPRRFFETIMRNFGSGVDVREVLLDGKVVAVSMNLYFRDQMHTYYAASSRDCWKMVPNDFMYFDHLRWAGENGYSTFDFGRSKVGTGGYDFKKHWATAIRPLPYEVVLVKRQGLPNFSQANPKFALATRVWQRMPLAMTRLLGPRLVALFP